MSKLETNTIDTISGSTSLQIGSTNTSTITLGTSGDSIVIPSGATITNNGTQSGFGGTNTPAFEAYVSSTQTITDNVMTKIQFNTENFDTNSYYDNSTNYRFTPLIAGKYFVYANVMGRAGGVNLQYYLLNIYKNGSQVRRTQIDCVGQEIDNINIFNNAILDFNGSTDYVEVFAQINDSSGNPEIYAGSQSSFFGAYKIIE